MPGAGRSREAVCALVGTDMNAQIEITAVTKVGGPLTKRITLAADGTLKSDASACVMSRGAACRVRLAGLDDFANYIGTLAQNEAVALGMMRPDLPDNVEITTKGKLNGTARSDLIARTGDHITYPPDRPALALIDVDAKGMPDAIRKRIKERGGFCERPCRRDA